ncbi:AAC(3) family N-acetyltransferase [Fredinandcohnia sp. QZ13]|uniref:AAC(3) family N-acetyltransferase n=1 Tax=Fredinandcohnia sp. QZ13 TaxID=3073144 RepID=UPI0028535D1E|nr:AAC(3) family N-acetyltransferase [Fredinandcohnia sp. QZ13]MDR4885925.1 AAC(3) family N-acetyltransferase [Fredinandcohnia sp. QZ13]
MYTKQDLLDHLRKLNIDENGTLLVHSSMKSIGQVEGGADTVLDALSEYMKNGLLVFPTHTWSYINAENPRFYVDESPSCVGLLTELFRKRPGVVRSWHPTHSVAALGKGAREFVEGNEKFDTPCARESSWGKLLDKKARILLIGVDLRRCTYIHGVEEWLDIPDRLTNHHEQLYTVLPDNTEIAIPQRRHIGHTSEKYERVDDVFLNNQVMYKGHFGDATVRVCDTVKMTELLTHILKEEPALFS